MLLHTSARVDSIGPGVPVFTLRARNARATQRLASAAPCANQPSPSGGLMAWRVVSLAVACGVAAVIAGVTSAGGQEPTEPPVRLPPLEVTGTRLPGSPLPVDSVPATVDVIPGETLRATGEVTLQETLRRLPGVSTADQQGNSFQMDLAVRGFQGTSVTGAPQGISVFVDGVRVNEPTVEEINFDLLPLDDVERVELIRGPGAVFGRNTLGGVLNIVTRRGAEVREIVPEAEWGSFGRQKYRLRLGGTEGPFDYYVAGTFFTEDGWRDASASRVGRLFARVGLRDGGTDLSLSYQRAQNRIEQPGSLPESELRQHRTRNFTRGDFFEPLMNAVTLNLKQELGEHWAVAATLFTRTLDSEQFNVNLAHTNSRSFTSTATVGGTVEATHQATLFGRSNRLVLGVEYAYADARVRVFQETSAGQREIDSDVRDGLTTVGGWVLNTFELGRNLLASGTVGLFFQNVGDTRRQGIEVELRGKVERLLEPWVNYAYTEATFRDEVLLGTSRLTVDCAAPPCTQLVRKGSELPLVPRHRINAGVDAHLTDWLTFSLSGAYVGRQWFRGDEANAERPLTDYVVLNASLTARVKALTAFVAVQNLLVNEYETFGTFAPNFRAEGAPVQRFLTPAPPINFHAGLAWRF